MVEVLFKHFYVMRRPRFLARAIQKVFERVQEKDGAVDPKTARAFVLTHQLGLVSHLVRSDDPRGGYQGENLRVYQQLADYPLALRKNVFSASMRGVVVRQAQDIMALRWALGLSKETTGYFAGVEPDAPDARQSNRFFQLLYPASAWRRRMLKRMGPA